MPCICYFNRTELKLFASIVRCKSLPGVTTRHTGIDIVLIRENTEGEYSNLEHEVINIGHCSNVP